LSVSGVRSTLRGWGRRQLYSFFSSIGALLGHRVGTLMTVLVLGVAMALPLGLHVTLANLEGLDFQEDEWGAITVFLHPDADSGDAGGLAEAVNERADADATLISPEQGMQEFSRSSGYAQVEALFDENPLPWVVLVTPRMADPLELGSTVSTLVSWLQEQPVVELVQVDYKWLKRLSGLLDLGRAFVSVLTVVFSLAVVVVVANTIRLDVANRAEEIQVLSLVGAGDGFIRLPFLYSGFWYGLLGALFALVLLSVSVFYLHEPLEHLLESYGAAFQLEGLTARDAVMILLAGGFLGLGGAWISVERHLHHLREAGTLGRR
jgi:cell division transport system permease protein